MKMVIPIGRMRKYTMSNLNDVKQGDIVALQVGWHSTGFHSGIPVYKKVSVTKVTAREVTVLGKRFLKATGYLLGAGNYPDNRVERIKALTPEMEKMMDRNLLLVAENKKRRGYLNIIDSAKFQELDTDKLAKIAAILQEKAQ